jgi:3-hydroxyisobutyrate dehydrogenase-like beta-hydroxyacid dehydrogenase
MKETVGFIGLGGMGPAMATNLLKAGYGLRVYNRTAEKARPLLEFGARLARSSTEAAEPPSKCHFRLEGMPALTCSAV